MSVFELWTGTCDWHLMACGFHSKPRVWKSHAFVWFVHEQQTSLSLTFLSYCPFKKKIGWDLILWLSLREKVSGVLWITCFSIREKLASPRFQAWGALGCPSSLSFEQGGGAGKIRSFLIFLMRGPMPDFPSMELAEGSTETVGCYGGGTCCPDISSDFVHGIAGRELGL